MAEELEHVPTVPELVKRGLARPVAYSGKGNPSHYQVSPEGQDLINGAMKRNAEKLRLGLVPDNIVLSRRTNERQTP